METHWPQGVSSMHVESLERVLTSCAAKQNPENTYKALRLVGKEYNLYYSVFCNNEHELYNLTVRTPAIASEIMSLTLELS